MFTKRFSKACKAGKIQEKTSENVDFIYSTRTNIIGLQSNDLQKLREDFHRLNTAIKETPRVNAEKCKNVAEEPMRKKEIAREYYQRNKDKIKEKSRKIYKLGREALKCEDNSSCNSASSEK